MKRKLDLDGLGVEFKTPKSRANRSPAFAGLSPLMSPKWQSNLGDLLNVYFLYSRMEGLHMDKRLTLALRGGKERFQNK